MAFVLGGLAIVAVVYLLLRASGLWYKLTADSKTDWIESLD
jgi:hypothetical protein